MSGELLSDASSFQIEPKPEQPIQGQITPEIQHNLAMSTRLDHKIIEDPTFLRAIPPGSVIKLTEDGSPSGSTAI